MRFKTLVLIPLVAVSALTVSLTTSQSQASANAPQEAIVKVSEEQARTQAASRSAQRFAYASPKYNKKYAKEYMSSKYNWGDKQYSCLVKLWNHESGWRVKADNPNSSAYGIPQALPGSKMGAGWKDNPHVQIKWGLKYIKGRYETPCGAWKAFKHKGWY
jgi:hypothetical protein